MAQRPDNDPAPTPDEERAERLRRETLKFITSQLRNADSEIEINDDAADGALEARMPPQPGVAIQVKVLLRPNREVRKTRIVVFDVSSPDARDNERTIYEEDGWPGADTLTTRVIPQIISALT